MNIKTVEEKHYFAGRGSARSFAINWLDDPSVERVWFTDRRKKDELDRFEVIVMWTESHD